MNFNIPRKRTTPTLGIVSTKNENMDSVFIKNLGKFSRYNLYPQSETGAEVLSSLFGLNLNNIVLGNGSETLLRNLFLTLDYQTIQILEHSYEMAIYYNNVLNKNIYINQLLFDRNFSFRDTCSVGGDLLYLVNPHCPSCICFDEQIEKLSKSFKYVIIDRAYSNPLTGDFTLYDNVIYVSTFSKLGGVPGLRLGFAVGPTAVIQKLNCLKDSYEITIDSIEYLKFIVNNKNIIQQHIEEMRKCYSLLSFNHSGFSVHCGNFATFDSKDYKGKPFFVNGKQFTRVTLTDCTHYENLYCR